MINEKLKELSNKLDYSITSFEQRKQIVDEVSNDPFIIDYITEYTGVLTSDKALSEEDPVFNFLDRLSNYLLNCEEVKVENKNTQYKIYTDENAFRKALTREVKIGDMAANNGEEENVVHFLKQENRNFKKSKTQTVTKSDLKHEDLKDVLVAYDEYLKVVTDELKNHKDSNLTRFQLSRISGAVKQDMIDSKEILLGVFGYNSNPSESTTINWDAVDLSNPTHVRALLYLKPGYRNDEDLMYLVEDFNDKLKQLHLNKLQWEVIHGLRANMRVADIAREFEVDRQNIDKKIKGIVGRFIKKFGYVQ